VLTRSGTKTEPLDAVAWAAEGQRLGAGEVLLTSFDRDGTGEGYDLELLGAIAGAVEIPVIASGGARTAEHLAAAVQAGADAVLAASIFHDGVTTPNAIKRELAALGVRVRPQEAVQESLA
jgi:cyclase